MFKQITEHIWRLKVPFEKIYTAVWLLEDGDQYVLLDAATTEYDVAEYILPALKQREICPTHLVCSHHHEDHSGGMTALICAFPNAEVYAGAPEQYRNFTSQPLQDEQPISVHICAIALPGHTSDMFGLWDKRSDTVITGDALQSDGVDRWGVCVTDIQAYQNTLLRLRRLSVKQLLASHDFVPFGYRSEGAQVPQYLEQCSASLARVKTAVDQYADLPLQEITRLLNEKYSHLPPVPTATVRAMLKEKMN